MFKTTLTLKLVQKRIGGNFEILIQLLIKKSVFLEKFTFTGVANFARIPLTKFAMKDNTNDVTDEEVDESIPEEPVTFSPNAVTISGTYLQVNLYHFFLQNSLKVVP